MNNKYAKVDILLFNHCLVKPLFLNSVFKSEIIFMLPGFWENIDINSIL